MKLRLTILTLVVIFALLWGVVGVYAQDATPSPEAPPIEQPSPDDVEGEPVPIDLSAALSNAIVYLAYTLTLAWALQVGIEQLKPFIITPLAESLNLTEESYVPFMYIVRGVITVIAYVFIWGGTEATRAAAPFLSFVPDIALGVVTVLVVIGGESVINDLTDRLRALKEAAEMLKLPAGAQAQTSNVTAESGSTVNVDNTRRAPMQPAKDDLYRG